MANYAGARKPVTPQCEDCGSGKCHPYRDAGKEQQDGIGSSYGYEWLCGACKYKRDYPDASPEPLLPRERRPVALQKETLFNVEQL